MIENKTTLRPPSERRNFQWVDPSNNHHIVYRVKEMKKGPVWNGEVATMMDTAIRGRNGMPLVDLTPETENGRFVISLTINELFEVDDPKGKLGRILCVVRKIDGTGRLHYKLHTDARKADDLKPLNLYVSPKLMGEKNARKVTVDPLGRIRRAGD